jgi:hypothetical protein
LLSCSNQAGIKRDVTVVLIVNVRGARDDRQWRLSKERSVIEQRLEGFRRNPVGVAFASPVATLLFRARQNARRRFDPTSFAGGF